jgi:hypothetical protein
MLHTAIVSRGLRRNQLHLGRDSMRSWPLLLQPRFIVFTAIVVVTAALAVALFLVPSV